MKNKTKKWSANGSAALYYEDGSIKQIRYYDSEGRAYMDNGLYGSWKPRHTYESPRSLLDTG